MKHEGSHDAFAQEQLDGLRALARLSATAATDHDSWSPSHPARPDETYREGRHGARHAAHATGSPDRSRDAGGFSRGGSRDTGSFLRSEFLRRDRDWDPPLLRHARPAAEY